MVKISHIDDAFSEFSTLETSPVEGQSLLPKEKKKRKSEKIKNVKKPEDVGHFLKILISVHD